MIHNKSTNVSLLYRSLIFTISETVLIESTEVLKNASVAKQLIKKHFKKDSCLKEYLNISNSIISSNMIDEEKNTAFKYLEEVERFIQEKKWSKYQDEKKEFLSELKRYFNINELVNKKFPNYKLLVSTHLFIENCIGEKNIVNIEDKVKIVYTLVENLISKDKFSNRKKEIINFLKENKIDKLSILHTIKEFQNKAKSLKEEYQEIISTFLISENSYDLGIFLKKKINKYVSELKEISKEVDDVETNKRISEVVRNLNGYKKVEDSQMEEVGEKLIDVIDLIEILKTNNGE